jgi:hypothetical protein
MRLICLRYRYEIGISIIYRATTARSFLENRPFYHGNRLISRRLIRLRHRYIANISMVYRAGIACSILRKSLSHHGDRLVPTRLICLRHRCLAGISIIYRATTTCSDLKNRPFYHWDGKMYITHLDKGIDHLHNPSSYCRSLHRVSQIDRSTTQIGSGTWTRHGYVAICFTRRTYPKQQESRSLVTSWLRNL